MGKCLHMAALLRLLGSMHTLTLLFSSLQPQDCVTRQSGLTTHFDNSLLLLKFLCKWLTEGPYRRVDHRHCIEINLNFVANTLNIILFEQTRTLRDRQLVKAFHTARLVTGT